MIRHRVGTLGIIAIGGNEWSILEHTANVPIVEAQVSSNKEAVARGGLFGISHGLDRESPSGHTGNTLMQSAYHQT